MEIKWNKQQSKCNNKQWNAFLWLSLWFYKRMKETIVKIEFCCMLYYVFVYVTNKIRLLLCVLCVCVYEFVLTAFFSLIN